MKTRSLGKTGVEVSEICLGGLFTSSLGHGLEETVSILNAAQDLGITVIDTAPAYGDSEEILGKALKQTTYRPLISTKLGGRPQPFDPQSTQGLMESVETSLKNLGCETIDFLLIHEPDRPQQYNWFSSYSPLSGPVLEVIEKLKAQGKIRYSGLGGTTATELNWLCETGLFDVVLSAFNYNALYREAETHLFPTIDSHQMGLFLGSVLGQGPLARRHDEIINAQETPVWLNRTRKEQLRQYYKLSDDSGMSLVELSIRFALRNQTVSTILLGCKSADQLRLTCQIAQKGPLDEELAGKLDSIANLLPSRPYEEPMILPLGKDYYGPGPANVAAAIPVGQEK